MLCRYECSSIVWQVTCSLHLTDASNTPICVESNTAQMNDPSALCVNLAASSSIGVLAVLSCDHDQLRSPVYPHFAHQSYPKHFEVYPCDSRSQIPKVSHCRQHICKHTWISVYIGAWRVHSHEFMQLPFHNGNSEVAASFQNHQPTEQTA